MTTRIESGRAKLVIDPLEGIGKASVSIYIDDAGHTMLLDRAQLLEAAATLIAMAKRIGP